MKFNWMRRLRNPEVRSIIEQYTLTTGIDHDDGDLETVWDGWEGIHKLHTLLIVKAGLYHLYVKALEKTKWQYNNPIWKGKFIDLPGGMAPLYLITDLRLGRNGYFPSDDTYPYSVPDELDGLEDAIQRELGEFVFGDEYTCCQECYQPMRTSPDCYNWQPNFIMDDEDGYGYVHIDCMSPELLQNWMNKNVGKAVPYAILKKIEGFTTMEQPEDQQDRRYSYVKMIEFTSGMHPGQDDSPEKVTAFMSDNGIDVWFEYDAGQFDVTWRPLVRQADHDKAQQLLSNFDAYQGYSTADEMSRALKTGQSTEHIIVTKSDHIPNTDIPTDYTKIERI
jgi:hypothetical protein